MFLFVCVAASYVMVLLVVLVVIALIGFGVNGVFRTCCCVLCVFGVLFTFGVNCVVCVRSVCHAVRPVIAVISLYHSLSCVTLL